MIDSNAVTVTVAATLLSSVTETDAKPGWSLMPYNDGAVTVYIGGPTVTAAGAKKGIPVLAGAFGPGMDVAPGDQLFGITASGSASVIVLEVGR